MTPTTDDAPTVERAPLIPSRLGAALSAWLFLVGVYATIAITQAAVEQPMPRMLHSTVIVVLAIAAIAWLAVWIVVTVDRHTDAVVAPRLDAINRQVASNYVAIDALIQQTRPRRSRPPTPIGAQLADEFAAYLQKQESPDDTEDSR